MKIIQYIKKNTVFYFVTIMCITIILLILVYFIFAKMIKHVNSSNIEDKKTIIIDAGHGGEDGGAVGHDNITEKNINLSIALKLKDLLSLIGYDVLMIRENDKAIYDKDSTTLKKKKASDLKNRKKIIKENTDYNNIFVSIHQNKFPNEKYHGTQVFHSTKNEKSESLASNIRESIIKRLQPENFRELRATGESIFMLRNNEIPSVIVECGFLSNPEEAKKLNTEEYQLQMAFCIFCGIDKFYIENF
ncbi:MAG: N-acetylmuramoyl-L-alanine amidase [Candidatus Paraimprobicoccus trichonymphae]|uniref:N-acetylmuramoyl-L-alanine amidase n=1 Tax=Candidatus Paraimprobicoccus trichonymphae TaxID=3033793 RepID=A0AA48IBB4_9FIRM|nr:MAG: N-acetylmuramoyl-L-alanine amidase [Candidatus Paraimprobicoccus trichonymphae]